VDVLRQPRLEQQLLAPVLQPEIHRVDPEFGSTLRLLYSL
jgi:hypothetical protein